MSVEWPLNVNQKFYGLNGAPLDVAVGNEFIGGRNVYWKQNSRAIMRYSATIMLTSGELKRFWRWYNSTLGGRSGTFTCEALGSSEWRFSSVPEPQNTDRDFRELALEFEEAY